MSPSNFQAVKLSLPTPYPVGRINAYFLDGDEPTLIDTGVYSSKSLNALRDQLQQHGRRLEDIRRILVTHDHYDHAGAALHLSQLCPATLYLPKKASLLSQREAEAREKLFAFLLHCGGPRPLLEIAFQLFGAGDHFANRDAQPLAIEWLTGGETIADHGWSLEALFTPGHSPDHLCFFEAASGLLFCGDLLLPHITPNPLLYLDPDDDYRRTHSLLDYVDSVAKLEARAVRSGHPGHGPDIPDVAGLIATNKAFIEQRKNKLAKIIARGPTNPFALAHDAFGELDVANQYLAISETVAYLDLLEREHQAVVDWDAEIISVSAT
jgi:glyoxylase-like metal-dependent hydrolase (beta-lactamase superfamily II)